jgi:hypothetical protein
MLAGHPRFVGRKGQGTGGEPPHRDEGAGKLLDLALQAALDMYELHDYLRRGLHI